MRKWDELSMREKAEMMGVAVSNGITTLPEIKQAYNEFAEGGAVPEAQPAENDGWSMEDEAKYREWRSKLPSNLRNTNDNDYDMREAYKAGMQPTLEDDGFYHLGSRNPKTGRILKAPHHPTYLKAINTDARMGYYPRTEKGITYTDTWEGNLFGGGGYKPSERIKQRIAHYEGKAMTGATDPLSGKWAKNNSFESEANNFFNALPRDIREQVLSNPELADSLYSYSYNVGAGRFKERVVPALRNYYNGKGTVQDIENSMWASGDSKLRGLQRRRAEERKGVRNALIGDVPYLPSDTPSYPTIYDMPQYIPAQPQAFSAPLTSYHPVVLPDEQQPIVREAMAYDPKEIERQERQRGLDNFMTLMSMASPQQNNSMLGAISMLSGLGTTKAYGEGGDIYIKPENRGKFTALKERTGHSATWFKEHGTPAQKKMAVFALNARHWKHGLGGNLFDGTSQPSQQMSRPNIFRYDDGRYVYQAAPDAEEIEVSPINTLLPNPSQWTYQDSLGKVYTPHAAQVDTGSIIQDEERNPLVRAANNYFREAAYRAKDGTLALHGKYTMPAIAASALLPVAGEAAYPILANPYVDASITSAFAGHGLNHAINEGIDGWGDAAMTALEVTPLGRLAKPMYEGVVQPGMRLFNSTLTPRPQYSPIIQRSVGTNITTGTSEETAKAVEKGRKTLLDWVRSPFYKARLEDEPLYRVADDVVADAGKMIEDVPIDISKTKLDLNPSGLVNGITKTRPAIQTQLPDGTIIADLNTGLDVSVASDLGKDADETALHELLHYMTANSKGEPISKAGERIVSKGWMNPTETHFDAINIIHKNRSKSWQDYIMDQNESLLPQYDPVVKMVMEEPDKATSFLEKAGKSTQEAKNAIQSLRTRYSEWYDIQEQRAYLQQLFHSKIKPNLKNPNDAAEIEEYLSTHPEVLENFPAYKYIQEVRPGSIKDYAKYFSAALGTIPFISKPSKDE